MEQNREIRTGHVKFFDSTHGFGFIVDDDTKKEFFFHFSGTFDKVATADNVEFSLVNGKKGPIAVDVARVKDK
jgi:CspA family cold shock protein